MQSSIIDGFIDSFYTSLVIVEEYGLECGYILNPW
jgi:hypothetical protein